MLLAGALAFEVLFRRSLTARQDGAKLPPAIFSASGQLTRMPLAGGGWSFSPSLLWMARELVSMTSAMVPTTATVKVPANEPIGKVSPTRKHARSARRSEMTQGMVAWS